ncbi:MAG: relaxase domain-containing protein [Betaproteobacteria bacterium]|nr:relaxase domain-containing protein [Betaproteobacteria bacterium]
MLSIAKISAAKTSTLAGYFERTAGREDYYEMGGEPAGRWYGKGAERFGFSGELETGELGRIMAGFDPKTGVAMVENAGSEKRAAGWDCTFSAPKTVSTAWGVSDRVTQLAIQHAHDAAVEKSLAYLGEEAIFARRGHMGVIHEETRGIVATTYLHATSRNGDPQLHTHCIVMNLAERQDGTMGGIDLDTRHKMLAGALYRLELSENLREIGFLIKKDGDSFRIAGVPQELAQAWSSRHEEIQHHLQESGASGYEASKVAAVETRAAKGEIKRPELMSEWRSTGREHGFEAEHVHAIRSHGPAVARAVPEASPIIDRMNDHESTFSRFRLATELAKEAVGSGIRSEGVHALTDQALQDERIVTLEKDGQIRYSTIEMVAVEERMVETARALQADKRHQVGRLVDFTRDSEGQSLSLEQRNAVTYLTRETGAIAAVEGWAGTGKSYMLAAARESWEADGMEVRGLALSGKAAEGLEQSAKIDSQTIHSFLGRLDEGKDALTSRTVLVVDEAGMVGSRQMDRLITETGRAGAKLVLVGDSKQLQAVDAGGAFRSVTDEIGKVELSEVRRQVHEADREMVKAFREGRAWDALENLEERGRLHIERNAVEAKSKAVLGFMADTEAGLFSVILAGTRADVRHLNDLAREEMKTARLVAEQDVRISTTTGGKNFAQGEQIIFTRNDRQLGVKNGTMARIEEVSEGYVLVTTTDDRTIAFDPRQKNAFDHAYAVTTHKAQGMTVDTAHVYITDLANREWAYVAMSRAREGTRLYATKENAEVKEFEKSQLEKSTARSVAKDTTLDYEAVERMSREEERRVGW